MAATVNKQFSSIKQQQKRLKQQLQRDQSDLEMQSTKQQSNTLSNNFNPIFQTSQSQVSGSSLIKLYYQQNNYNQAMANQQQMKRGNSASQQKRYLNQNSNSSQSANNIIFKTSFNHQKKESNSLRQITKEQLAATTQTIQQQMLSSINANSQPNLHKSGSRAFLKSTIENLKKSNQLIHYQQKMPQEYKNVKLSKNLEQQINNKLDRQNSQMLLQQHQVKSQNNLLQQFNINKDKNQVHSNVVVGINNAKLNNFVFDYDQQSAQQQSNNNIVMYSHEGFNIKNTNTNSQSTSTNNKNSRQGGRNQLINMSGNTQNQSSGGLTRCFSSSSKNFHNQNTSNQGHESLLQHVQQQQFQQQQQYQQQQQQQPQQQFSLTRVQSKAKFEIERAPNQQMLQIQSMKVLHPQDQYYFQKEDQEQKRTLPREQSSGSLSRQKSQAKLQTFQQIQHLQQQQQLNTISMEHGGQQSMQREPSQSSILHSSQNQIGNISKHQKNPAIALVNCYSMATMMQSASGLNLINIKTHMNAGANKDCISPVRKALDQSDNHQNGGDQQQSRKLQRTGPVKIPRKENDIIEQQSQPIQSMTIHKENINFSNNELETSLSKQTRMSKKIAIQKLVNFDKVRDLLRKSSQERRQENAKQVKENTDEVLTRTASVMNFKQKQLLDIFNETDSRLTPILKEGDKTIDETYDEIQGLLQSMESRQ
ncbi:UNKNOWN [Stylonychia lemnae]|uniref:Uncharacterized protein n=1 Tax=Stylonychia lemnae TaxID=5949 RepID=A0A078AQV6_STYLE|nr:UNKNOWN [Stylonychia lemnae]|eukprot:CDW84599.1 UNKNOWN [Stylonychia lemnae]